jgi:hypothetical protein
MVLRLFRVACVTVIVTCAALGVVSWTYAWLLTLMAVTSISFACTPPATDRRRQFTSDNTPRRHL